MIINEITPFLFAALLLAPSASLYAADGQPAKPNIIFILADDLGYGDVHCYNPQRGKIPTPNIDRLASQGMRFTDGHSSSGVCSPSRYTLLTGRYHWRTRLQEGIVGAFGNPLIAPDRLTIGGLAKRHGYRTAAIGKWHLGWEWPKQGKQVDFTRPIENGPTARGFDTYFGTDVPNWPPYCFIENDRTLGIPTENLPPESFKNHLASLPGPAVKDWKLERILPTLGDRAAELITEATKKSEPFLLYMPLTAPHTPLAVAPEWQGKSGLNAYADFVMQTDAVVGRVLAVLEQSGAADHTLVVFTSDNGCAAYIGAAELQKMGHFPSGPLRGYKMDVWEGGHRVPFIVRWPGIVKPGKVCGQLVQQADLMATIADVLGAKLPSDAGEDSFSLLPLLKGEDYPVRETAVNCSFKGVPGVRQGAWKLILAPGSGGGRLSKGAVKADPIQLYNLADDLGETKNLADEQPERVAQMKTLIEKLITDGRSTPGAPQKNDVEVRRFSQNSAAPKKAKN